MNSISPGSSQWALQSEQPSVMVALSQAELDAGQMPGTHAGGFEVAVTPLPADAAIDEAIAHAVRALVLEVDPDRPVSMRRLATLQQQHPDLAVIAAVRDPSVGLVKTLLKQGVADVISLPLSVDEFISTMEQLRNEIQRNATLDLKLGKLVTIIPSVGGVGATTIATQAASTHAIRDAAHGRQTCLIDLDVQFGNAGTYLGARPKLTLQDLIDSGDRVDGELLRSACLRTASGLNVITAPLDILPLESISADQVLGIVELALNEFDTVYLDLPGNWTNWSLSLVARSQAILLVVEASIASLRQARRQIALLHSQGLGHLPVQIVVNRVEKKLFRTISLADVERVLGQPASYSIANDFHLVSAALDQGILVSDAKPGSKVARDIAELVEGCEALFGREF